jgi:integrase
MAKMTTGSITRHVTRDGRILWRVRVTHEGRRVSLGLYESRREAEQALASALAGYAALGEERGVRLSSWGETWLTRRATDGLHRAQHKAASCWRTHVGGAAFFDWPMRRISRQDVHRWVLGLLRSAPTTSIVRGRGPTRSVERKAREGERLSRQTAVNALALLRRALGDAADEGLVPGNVALGVRVPRIAETEDTWTFLDATEVSSLLALSLKDENRAVLTVAIYTGLRGGELWGLRWSDVRTTGDRPELHVRRSYRGPTKGGRTRHVPLLAPALEALRTWKAAKPGVGEALVFPSASGGCHHEGHEAGLRTALQKIGVDRRVRFHDLRHTCASHLVMGTWTAPMRLEDVREWLGHSTTAMTERYAHLGPHRLHELAAAARREAQ